MDIPSLRVRNTLASLFAPNPTALQEPVNQTPDASAVQGDINPVIQSLLNPSTESTDRLKQILDNMPKREDYAPSMGRKIMAGIAGLGGVHPAGISGGQPVGFINDPEASAKIRDQIAYEPFYRAMADYNAQLKPVSELSQAERSANTNARLTGATLLRDEQARNALDLKEKQGEQKNKLEQDKLQEKREYMAVVKAKNEMPNAAMAEDKDGKVYTWDKKNGQFIAYVTNDEGEIVHSSKLPDQTKLEIQQNNRLRQIAAQGSQQRQTVAAQGQKEIDVSNKTLENKKALKETVPGKNTAPVEGSSRGSAKPKVNDQKVFPNGKVGRWDGQGWVDTGKTAK